MENLLIALGILALGSPWVFFLITARDKRRQETLFRETLVYLKSGTAYEAEDVVDRIKRREKSVIERGLANLKKRGENLTEDPAIDMAQDIRGQLEKKYAGTDTE